MKTFYKKELKTVMAIFAVAFGLLFTNTAQAQTTIQLGNVDACDSWTSPWGTNEITSGFISSGNANIDTIWIVNLTVSESSDTSLTINACDSYTVPSGDTTLTATTIYTDVIANLAGCDSTLVLTVNISSGITNAPTGVNVSSCDSYTAPSGAVYTSSGAFLDTVAGIDGCPVVTTYNLTITGNTNTGGANIVSCGSYLAASGNTYDSTGIYLDTTSQVASGCDSVVTINLTVNSDTTWATSTQAIDACDSYTLPGNGTTYTFANNSNGVTHIDTVLVQDLTTGECPTITYNTFTLAWNGVATSSDSIATACGSFTWGDSTWTTSGTYSYPVGSNDVGCDSSVNVILTIEEYANAHPIEDSSVYNGNNITVTVVAAPPQNWIKWNSCGPVTVASGAVVDSAVLGGLSGIYTDTVSDAAGCKTRYLYEINIAASGTTNPDVLVFSTGACDSYTDENGVAYDANGLYSYVRANASNGCDETVNLTVSGLLSSSTGSIDVNACNNFTWNGTTYDSTGTYTQTFGNAAGCDSVHTLNLTIGSTSSSEFVTIGACDAFEYYNANYDTLTTSTPGVYTSHFEAANGCDSALVVTLNVSQSITGSATYYGCSDYTYGDSTYTANTTVLETLVANNGCDSVVTITILLNDDSSINTNSHTDCNNYTDYTGYVHTTDTLITEYFQTPVYGCDSIVLLTVTITNTQASMTVVECGSEYYTPSGDTLTTAGMYMDTLVGAGTGGCDSILTINLSFGAESNTEDDHSCNGAYNWNGTTYTADGTYTWTGTNANGCDSVEILNLTFGADSPVQTVQVTSEGPWTDYDGNIQEISGIFTYSYTNASGCDSTINVALTVNDINTAVNESLSNVNVYPNPTNGNVTVDLGGLTDISIKVTNLIGEVIYEDHKISNSTYNLYIEEAAGLYFVEISNENNKEVIKLLVE